MLTTLEEFVQRFRRSLDAAVEPVVLEVLAFFHDRPGWEIVRPDDPGEIAYSLKFVFHGTWAAKLDVNEKNEARLAVFKPELERMFEKLVARRPDCSGVIEDFFRQVDRFSTDQPRQPNKRLSAIAGNRRVWDAFVAAMQLLESLPR